MVSIINARIHILMNFVGPHKQEIICMKCQTLFLRTNKKKNAIHLSSTGYSQRVLMHKFSFRIQRYHFLNCRYNPVTCTLKKQQTALKHLKWFFFFQKIRLDISYRLSPRTHSYKLLNHIYWRKSEKKKISCSKLTMSLVNDSLKFTSSDTQICWNMQKLLTVFQQKISEYCILNLLKPLTRWPLMSSLS